MILPVIVTSVDMMGDGIVDGDRGGRGDKDREEEKKARSRENLKRHREREKEKKEQKERRMNELKKENQEIEQRTAVHQQVR